MKRSWSWDRGAAVAAVLVAVVYVRAAVAAEPLEDDKQLYSYYICSQTDDIYPFSYDVEVRKPVGFTPLDKLYQTLTVFKGPRAVAYEPVVPMTFGDGEQEMGFEIGNGRVTLFDWKTRQDRAELLLEDGSRKSLRCRKEDETRSQRFRHIERTYLFQKYESPEECDKARRQNPDVVCERKITFHRDGAATILWEKALNSAKFELKGNRLVVNVEGEELQGQLQFTLQNHWRTLRLESDGSVWKLQPLPK